MKLKSYKPLKIDKWIIGTRIAGCPKANDLRQFFFEWNKRQILLYAKLIAMSETRNLDGRIYIYLEEAYLLKLFSNMSLSLKEYITAEKIELAKHC